QHRCVVAPDASRDFDAASKRVSQYLSDHGLFEDLASRPYFICERYTYDGEAFARYSLPLKDPKSAPLTLSDVTSKLEICVVTRNKAKARAWYREIFGVTFNESDRAELGGVTLVLWGFPDTTPASHDIYQFKTRDLERAHATLKQR